MADTYRTVGGRGQTRFTVQGSEFIGHVAPAESVDAAESFIEEIQEEYDDATHNVPAYRVPAEPTAGGSTDEGFLREYASDADEPSGSAGKPALNVLQGQELRNVVVVITRYYGGTNLGIGGLARAYARATTDAITDAGVIEERPHERFAIAVAYDDSGTVRSILESADVEFDADYEADVRFTVRVPLETAADLRDRLRSATSNRVQFPDQGR
ncbi:IMPACT family protein [Halobacterium salinarum]|uniref:Impact N-terminal domain-containing protein n=2 Tax=Natrinema TaxID=88723 RepID=L0JRH3_NATP1|nr:MULTISPECIES: YigZ family protein [Halobacteria]AGB34125.1 hypothetical protein Natpe_4435 [Natrinema pellirubrum DSM 15624]ELY72202.1 hypothetical protein C488_15572 [Natrinema pellirubrum DSM 15624]ELY73580.1 hypothetical protein C487_16960 [Natrinema pallidum DSM 3751]MDL0138975.1 IMPACT family protein [Halobacterium salinarum]